MMKALRSIRMLAALVLTLTFIVMVPLQTVGAAENKGKYVSEVYVAYGKDADAAKKVLGDKGFTPVEGNLNDGGKTYAMMGYKTTNDIRDSITDLAVMNMNGGYSVEDYKKQKGSSADLNADEGKQWIVLYASKNSMAGRPLTPDFVIQDKNKAPSGYEGNVHLIGEKGAVNVVSAAFKNYSTFSTVWQNLQGDYSKYIFLKLSNDIKTYDESAGNMTASSFNGGILAIAGFGGLVLGGALGAVITILVKRKKKSTE